MHKWPNRLLLGSAALLTASLPAMAAESKIISPTHLWNEIWTEVLYDLLLIGIPFGVAALYMMIRYRAKSPGQVGEAVNLSAAATWGWIIVPCALFLADDLLLFGKGWTLWNVQRVVPANAVEVKVTGHQWFFEFDYGKGITDQELVVEVGKPVVLRMTSEDVIHSFGLTEYRLKEDLIPGRITYLWFYPDEPKVTQVDCMEFCGTGHSQMATTVRALPKAEFDQWLGKHKSASTGALQFASQSPDVTASK
jgi:cytochrome c oxidase subunit II